jgi:UDP-N-acetylmuramate: L-alanyl-gamma-D-glutamyl-meso-diaminopimelate ligase
MFNLRFLSKITNGGGIVYNENDSEVKRVAEAATNPLEKYHTAHPIISSKIELLRNPEGFMPIEVLLTLIIWLDKWICQNMGVDEAEFYEAIASFKGASKRLEKIAE